MNPDPDVTIEFHRTQWWNISNEAQRLIGMYVGPLWPDAKGVVRFTVAESRWREIERAMNEGK